MGNVLNKRNPVQWFQTAFKNRKLHLKLILITNSLEIWCWDEKRFSSVFFIGFFHSINIIWFRNYELHQIGTLYILKTYVPFRAYGGVYIAWNPIIIRVHAVK